MQRLEHPNPYNVSWVKDEHKILVSEHYNVKLKIDCYFDEVLCDIMSMDFCRILLGRPWKYDRNVVYMMEDQIDILLGQIVWKLC